MSDARETILNRLRGVPANPLTPPPVPADRGIFADWPEGESEAWSRLFAERLALLKGVTHLVADRQAAADCLARLVPAGSRGLRQPGRWLTEVVALSPGLAERLPPLPAAIDAPGMAGYDAGVTGADWLIARTGSIVIASDGGSGRRLSVLPPLHVVVASVDRVVPSLEEALAGLTQAGRTWSSASFITGPSRTADIEKILVLGAHGPKRLEVILVQEQEQPNSAGENP